MVDNGAPSFCILRGDITVIRALADGERAGEAKERKAQVKLDVLL